MPLRGGIQSTPGVAVGSVLAMCAYAPNSQVVNGTTSSSFTDLDATNLVVTFTAPASGKVVIRWSGLTNVANVGTAYYWSVRAATTDVTAAQVTVSSANGTGAYICTTRDGYVTGLTPGQSYTWKWTHATSAANTGSTVYGSANSGQAAVMTILAA